MLSWSELMGESQATPEGTPGECHTARCGRCGRFTRRLYLTWIGFPPEPDNEVGDCCLQPNDRTHP